MVVVAGDVFEAYPCGLVRHPISGSVGPFYEHDLATVDNVIPRKVREIIGAAKSVKVEMKNGCALSVILVHERERRAGHISANSNTAANRLCQCGLATAEVAFEADDGRCLKTPPEFLTPGQ